MKNTLILHTINCQFDSLVNLLNKLLIVNSTAIRFIRVSLKSAFVFEYMNNK